MNARLTAKLFFVVMVALLLTAPFAAAQEGPQAIGLRPDAPPYAVHGPYWVGTREFVVEPESERPLPLTVWYPALSDFPEGPHSYTVETPPLTFVGQALPDAAPALDAGPYPLVLFSHGAGSFRFGSVYLAEHLASYGFVVMAPDHTGDTMANYEEEGVFMRSHVTRPIDIVRVLDFAAAETAEGGALAGMIDNEHVAVTGHSSGAWTAFLAGGGQRDTRALHAFCAENPEEMWVCGTLIGQEQTLASLLGLDAVPEGLWPPVGDPRVDAIVAMAPGNATLFGAEGLAAIKIPALVMIGDLDVFLPYDSFGPPVYAAISGAPKAFVTLQGANHFLFGNDCNASPWAVEMGLFFLCSDSIWDMDRAHDLTNHFVTAFLLNVLKGDTEAGAALAPEAVAFPGITYEAQGF